MAITVTAASVVKGTGAVVTRGTAGETITAGQVVYLKASDSRLWLAQADGTSAEAEAVGFALHAASAGQPLTYQTEGQLALNAGGGGAIGVAPLVLSGTAGAIEYSSDTSSGWYLTNIGYGVSATTIQIVIRATGLALP